MALRHRGDGTFADRTADAGLAGITGGLNMIQGDYDGDGWPDLYVSNLSGPNRLYRNQSDGTFTDLAVRLGVACSMRSFPTWFFDYDSDGNLDLFVGSYTGMIGDFAAHHLGRPPTTESAW